MNNNYHYPGEELEVFAEAGAWKKYLAQKIKSYVSGDVLEVGAGLGETTSYLVNPNVRSWTCLEPDAQLVQLIREKIHKGALPANTRAINGTLTDLEPSAAFDTILYIDVLEHIRGDRQEIEQAIPHLRPGGRLVVLSPALPFLFSKFDLAIGHERRYTKKTLRAVTRGSLLREEKLFYLESAGAILLLLNKLFFRKKYPTKNDIRIWQRIMPLSRLADKILFYSFGKSLIGIWQKREKNL